jgi:hypothetical protein
MPILSLESHYRTLFLLSFFEAAQGLARHIRAHSVTRQALSDTADVYSFCGNGKNGAQVNKK